MVASLDKIKSMILRQMMLVPLNKRHDVLKSFEPIYKEAKRSERHVIETIRILYELVKDRGFTQYEHDNLKYILDNVIIIRGTNNAVYKI